MAWCRCVTRPPFSWLIFLFNLGEKKKEDDTRKPPTELDCRFSMLQSRPAGFDRMECQLPSSGRCCRFIFRPSRESVDIVLPSIPWWEKAVKHVKHASAVSVTQAEPRWKSKSEPSRKKKIMILFSYSTRGGFLSFLYFFFLFFRACCSNNTLSAERLC